MKRLILMVLLAPMAMTIAMETGVLPKKTQPTILEQANQIILTSTWYKERVNKERVNNAFIHAVKFGTFTDVAACLNNGADIHTPFSSDEDTALHYAAMHGDSIKVDLLLAWGADPRAMTVTGATASYLAFSERYNEIAEQLLEAGAQYAPRGISLQEHDRRSEPSSIIEGVLSKNFEDMVLCPVPTNSLALSTPPVEPGRKRSPSPVNEANSNGDEYDTVGNRFSEMSMEPK